MSKFPHDPPDFPKVTLANRLAEKKSPYLLQHAHNPVHWQPWDEGAFVLARKSNRPVFPSIGYATCHWCHVMERESFESPLDARCRKTPLSAGRLYPPAHPRNRRADETDSFSGRKDPEKGRDLCLPLSRPQLPGFGSWSARFQNPARRNLTIDRTSASKKIFVTPCPVEQRLSKSVKPRRKWGYKRNNVYGDQDGTGRFSVTAPLEPGNRINKRNISAS